MTEFAICKRTLPKKDKKHVFKLLPDTRSLVAYEGKQETWFKQDIAVLGYANRKLFNKGGMELEIYSIPSGDFTLVVPVSGGKIEVTVNMDEMSCRSCTFLLMRCESITTEVDGEVRQTVTLETLIDLISEFADECSVLTGDIASELNNTDLSTYRINVVSGKVL